MSGILPQKPSAQQFADAWLEHIGGPAVSTLSGRDSRMTRSEAGRADKVEGLPALALDDIADHFERTGVKSRTSGSAMKHLKREVLQAAEAAVDGDGAVDVSRLPVRLQADFRALVGDGQNPPPVDPVDPVDPGTVDISRYRFRENTVRKVMEAYGLSGPDDRLRLIQTAVQFDSDQNRSLKRSEIEAAAKLITSQAQELGIISDLDKTIIPEHNGGLPTSAYPGVATMMRLLEFGGGGQAGDMRYVTARTPGRVAAVPDWLNTHELPEGPISTGVSGIPWVAEAEKIRDISEIFDASGNQRFVLFGDSSHRDPEAYRAIQAKYPDRVIGGFIHRVNNVRPDRVEGLHLIENYAEAAAILMDLGVFTEDQARQVMVAAQIQGLDISDRDIEGLLARP